MAGIKRSVSSAAVSCLLCFGFWQLGHGTYIPAKAWVAQELMQRAWRRSTPAGRAERPWPWADTSPVARLRARQGAVELIVLAGSSGRTLAFGPGHMSTSVLPGEVGNSVIAGHRDTHFQFLKHLQVGESLEIERPGGRFFRYRIVDVNVVDSRRGSLVLDTVEPMLSLVTCYPFDTAEAGGPMRFVATAELVESWQTG